MSRKLSLPLLNVLYHRLYDRITEEAPEYYLYQAELNLLKTHGKEIAELMGFPSVSSVDDHQERSNHTITAEGKPQQVYKSSNNDNNEDDNESDDDEWNDYPENRRIGDEVNEKWGDQKVGKWNEGVNGEEGLAGERGKLNNGWDIVELGAG